MNCINTTGVVTHARTHTYTLAYRHTYRENKVYFSLFQSSSLLDTQCTVSLFHPIQTALMLNARINKWKLKRSTAIITSLVKMSRTITTLAESLGCQFSPKCLYTEVFLLCPSPTRLNGLHQFRRTFKRNTHIHVHLHMTLYVFQRPFIVRSNHEQKAG